MKKKIILLLAILIPCVFVFSIFLHDDIVYLEKTNSENLHESVDFIQYWYYSSFTEKDWQIHFSKLKDNGYESIILQSTCSFNDNGFENINQLDSFFPEKTVSKILTIADDYNFGVYVGLAHSDLWWNTKLYKTEAEKWGNFQAQVAEIVYNVAQGHNSFKGFYMPFEPYSNNSKFESYWAKTFNIVLDKLNNIAPNYPFLISPFKSGNYIMTKKDIYKFASRFYSQINFREYDIVAPQDGSGNAPPEYTTKTKNAVNDYLSAFYTASQNNGKCIFGVNIEFFTSKKGVYATENRIKQERLLANKYASVIFSFSYSHYYAK